MAVKTEDSNSVPLQVQGYRYRHFFETESLQWSHQMAMPEC